MTPSKELHNPFEIILKIWKEKYKKLIIPFAVIVLTMTLVVMFHIPYVQYLSGLAFVYYLFIMMIYRIQQSSIEVNESNLLSPMNGKVRQISKTSNGYEIILDKPFFSTAELRSMTNTETIGEINDGDTVSWEINGKWVRIYTTRKPHPQGQLLGVAPGHASVKIVFDMTYELGITEGQFVYCGQSILATSKRSSLIGNEGRENE